MRLSVTLALASLVAACAPLRQEVALDLSRNAKAERRATRAELPPGELGAFLRRAAMVLAGEGHRIVARTATQIVTAPREEEVACGSIACRFREVAMINVSGRTVRLQLIRAVRAPSDERWRMELAPDDEVDTAEREVRLLQAMLGPERDRVEVSLR
jgi:hypothetical protein